MVGTRTDSLKCARYRRMLCYSIMDGYHQEMDDYQLKYFTAMCCIMHGICSSMTIHYLIAIIQKYTSLLLQRILIEVELTDWHATKDKIATYLFGWAGYQGINFYGLYARRISFEIWIVFFVWKNDSSSFFFFMMHAIESYNICCDIYASKWKRKFGVLWDLCEASSSNDWCCEYIYIYINHSFI